jgi:hypothetical protein
VRRRYIVGVQSRQSIRITRDAERVPVVRRGHDQECETRIERLCRAIRIGRGPVVQHLAEALQRIGEIVLAERVQVDALGFGDELAALGRDRIVGDVHALVERIVRLVGGEVITQRRVQAAVVHSHAALGARAQLRTRAGERARLDVKLAGGIGQRVRALTHPLAHEHAEIIERACLILAKRRGRRSVAEVSRLGGVRRIAEIGALVDRVELPTELAGEQAAAIEIRSGQQYSGAPFVELQALRDIHRCFMFLGAFQAAVTGRDGAAIEVGVHDGVEHTGGGIRTVQRGRAIPQHFDALDAGGRERVHVGDLSRRRADVLIRSVGSDAATIQQNQRVAAAETPQVHSRDVAASVVRTIGGAVDLEGAGLRDVLQ